MNDNVSRKVKLSPGVSKVFDEFIISTNLLHHGPINANTWEALYEFIEYTHAHHVRLGEDQLKELLLADGTRPQDADDIAQVYFHGRNLLYKKRPWDTRRMYGWLRSKKEKEMAMQSFRERSLK